jgi:homoserine dehydrogenase
LGEARTRYYLNLKVLDRPGVLATVARVVADSDVSIQVVRQDGTGSDAHLVLRTHAATEAQLSRMLEGLRALEVVRDIVGVMRVEGEATP